jgi:hypothetical protein
MGYRTYIGSMPKREYNKIKSMNEEQLKEFYKIENQEGEDYWYKGVYQYGKELYEFGKYTDFNPPKKSFKPFFKNKELMEKYEEYDFNIVTKEFLQYIIENYKEKISSYYNDMVNPFFGEKEESYSKDKPTNFLNSIKTEYNYPDNNYIFDFEKITQEEQNALFKMIEHIRSMRNEWKGWIPFNLENDTPEITNSWKYEYSIFELVRIYKTFDWKRNVMIYYGY